MSDLSDLQLDLTGFINNIFRNTAMPPFSYRLELDGGPAALNNFLQSFVLKGCEELFQTDLHNLTDSQVKELREYLLSIGYDADYDPITETKLVKIYHPDGTPGLKELKINRFNITFKPADNSLDNYNSHRTAHSLF